MFGWVRQIFSRRKRSPRPAAQAATPALRISHAAVPVRPRRPATTRPAVTAPVEIVELAEDQPACPPELVDAAVAQVLRHFDANQPGPGSFPATAARIIDVINQPEPDFNKLVHMVGQDAAITARLLQAASSARYAGGAEVASVRAAALKLGLREVGAIALGVAGRSLFEADSRAEYALYRDRWDALFHESMTSAFATAALSLGARVGRSDRAFLAGMLHDIGKPIALRALAALHLAGRLPPRVLAGGVGPVIERVHVEIGARMTAAWSLPAYLQSACARHHEPGVSAEPQLVELHLVRVVDGLKAERAGAATGATRHGLETSAAALGLDEHRLRVSATELEEMAKRVTEIFGVEG